MIRAGIVGAGGRMGQALIRSVLETKGIEIAGVSERPGSSLIGKDPGEAAFTGKIGIKAKDTPKKAFKTSDVIIDFSSPDASMHHMEYAVETDKAIVIGTTGFSKQQRNTIKKMAKETRIVMAPNMSVGINLLLKLVSTTATALGDSYDVEIVETHHRHKKDAPSGTAIRIAEEAAKALTRDFDDAAVYCRKGIIGERETKEIGIQTLRAGDVVGDHTIIFATPGERIELTHKAQSRDTFANGAVKAAIWLVEKPRGLYDMHDVLGLKD